MDTGSTRPSVKRLIVRQGEPVNLASDDPNAPPYLLTCDDVARMALRMYDHSYFFSLRRDLTMNFSRDLNGSGTQGLDIRRKERARDLEGFVSVTFHEAYKDDHTVLYEADLIKDKGKDYEPTINVGKRPFAAQSAVISIKWDGEDMAQWRSDLLRLSQSPKSLNEWLSLDLEMLVRCGARCWRTSAVFSKTDIQRHIDGGTNLDQLKARLKCKECGKRNAVLLPF